MSCAACGAAIPAEAVFCNSCGATQVAACARCGHHNAPGSRFCNPCGPSFTAPGPAPRLASPRRHTPTLLAESILSSRAGLAGELRQVTVLFCDIVGSTALAERLGAEEMH